MALHSTNVQGQARSSTTGGQGHRFLSEEVVPTLKEVEGKSSSSSQATECHSLYHTILMLMPMNSCVDF